MKVIRARAMGMCFGVVDALAETDKVEDPGGVAILGELVHNGEIKSRLRMRGFPQISESERDALPGTGRVLVTAHGISRRRRQSLLDSGKILIDTTCPLVRHAHDAARLMAGEGRLVVVIGRRNHVEVKGIVEDLDDFEIVETEAEVKTWPGKRIGVICQTTIPDWKAERIVRLIRVANAGRDVRFVNTICRPTRDRQDALAELAAVVRVIIIVGGVHSNNTRELADRAESLGMTAHHIERAAELRPEWFAGLSVVGLTAGTSTPADLIDAVETALQALQPSAIADRVA